LLESVLARAHISQPRASGKSTEQAALSLQHFGRWLVGHSEVTGWARPRTFSLLIGAFFSIA